MPFSASLYTVFLCALFGANAVAIKVSFGGMGTFTTAGLRFSLAAFAISLWALGTGKNLRLKKGQLRDVIVVSCLFCLQLSLFYLGISHTTATRGTLIINMLPFFILVLAHFTFPDDRITFKKIVGMLFGFLGVVILITGGEQVSGNHLKGDIATLMATMVWSCNAVYMKRALRGIEPFIIVVYPMYFAAPLFFLEGYLWDQNMISQVNVRVASALFYQAFVTASFGFIAWNTLLKRYGATALHSFVFIMPIAGVLASAWLLGEPVTFKIVLSLISITAGIVVVSLGNGR